MQRLRERNVEVHTVAVRGPDRESPDLSDEERAELGRTYVITQVSPVSAMAANFTALVANPRGYLGGLFYALKWGLSSGVPGRLLFTILYFVEAVLVGQYMRRNGLSHLHCHFSSSVGLLVRKTFPVTLSMTIHGPAEFLEPPHFRLAQKVGACSFVCAVSEHGRARLAQLAPSGDPSRLRVVRAGVDLHLYQPRPSIELTGPFEIICVARLDPIKGHRILLSAVERLAGEGRRVRLRLVGDGSEREDLEKRIAAHGLRGRVVLEGWANPERVRRLYRGADAFVLASFDEGVPAVLMEAMAIQIPCVATRVGGVPELIQDGVDGLLVPPGDEQQLADALGRLMDDASLRRRLGEAGRRRVAELHDLDRNVDQLAGLFREALCPSAARPTPAPGHRTSAIPAERA